MNLIVTKMKWIMLVSGVLTSTMFYAAIAPKDALLSLVFIGLVLSHGTQFLSHQAGIAVLVDALMVILFLIYLLTAKAWGTREL